MDKNTTSGSIPGEGYNLQGAERLSPSVRALLREIPTRAQIKERIMDAAESARAIARSLEQTSKLLMSYAASNCENCSDVEQMVALARDAKRIETLKLVEFETASAAALHGLFHHLHEMPPEHADVIVRDALEIFTISEENLEEQKRVLARAQRLSDYMDIIRKVFGDM